MSLNIYQVPNEFKCEICDKKFERYVQLTSHILGCTSGDIIYPHIPLKEYFKKYPNPSYEKGIPPNNYYTYILCNPLINIECKITYENNIYYLPNEPFWVGEGRMGKRFRESITESKCKDFTKILSNIHTNNKKPIIYIIKDNMPKEAGILLEQMLIKKIGRRNHINPNKYGPLLNKNDGGRCGFVKGEYPIEVIEKISSGRTGLTHSVKSKLLMSKKAKLRPPKSKEEILKISASNRKTYYVISPFNEYYIVYNLKEFCNIFKLSKWGFTSTATKRQKSFSNGWKCEIINKVISKNEDTVYDIIN